MSRIILFGNDVFTAQQARKVAALGDGLYTENGRAIYASEPLCRWQASEGRFGILEIEIVESVYGYSVRYASGLMNFGLLAAKRMGNTDGSLTAAMEFCRKWQAADPERRYVSSSCVTV
jgi:hypothetical protein